MRVRWDDRASGCGYQIFAAKTAPELVFKRVEQLSLLHSPSHNLGCRPRALSTFKCREHARDPGSMRFVIPVTNGNQSPEHRLIPVSDVRALAYVAPLTETLSLTSENALRFRLPDFPSLFLFSIP